MALPAVAACTVIAIVLSLTLSGTSGTSNPTRHGNGGSTSTSAPHADASATNLTGTYVGVDQGTSLKMLMELTQSSSLLTGTLIVSGSHAPAEVGEKPGKINGKLDLATKSFTGSVPAFGLNFAGRVSGTSLAFAFGQISYPDDTERIDVVFERGTVQEFRRITAKAIPSANAQVNLTRALSAAKMLYEKGHTFRNEEQQFSVQEPRLIWTGKQCNALPVNCVSEHVLDLSAEDDGQGIALAAYSASTSTCWYAIDLEAMPRVVPDEVSSLVPSAGSPNASITGPGVYYARSSTGSKPSYCIASLVLHPRTAGWGTDYANAGVIT